MPPEELPLDEPPVVPELEPPVLSPVEPELEPPMSPELEPPVLPEDAPPVLPLLEPPRSPLLDAPPVVLSVLDPPISPVPDVPAPPMPAPPTLCTYTSYSAMLKLPLVSVSYWLNCLESALSLRASFLLILLSLFLSRSVKLMVPPPLLDAPALPLASPEPEPLLDAPLESVAVEPDASPLPEAPPLVAELSPGLPVVPLLVEAPPEPDAPPVVSVVAPVLLLPLLLPMLSANAPNDASDMDIANVKMNFLFINLSLKGFCEKGTCNISTALRRRVVRKSESTSTDAERRGMMSA